MILVFMKVFWRFHFIRTIASPKRQLMDQIPHVGNNKSPYILNNERATELVYDDMISHSIHGCIECRTNPQPMTEPSYWIGD